MCARAYVCVETNVEIASLSVTRVTPGLEPNTQEPGDAAGPALIFKAAQLKLRSECLARTRVFARMLRIGIPRREKLGARRALPAIARLDVALLGDPLADQVLIGEIFICGLND